MPRVWKDRIVERPRTFNIQNNPDGTVTLVPSPGVVIQEGTPVNAVNMNGIEQDIASHKADYEYKTATVVGRQIRVPRQSNTARIPFRLLNDIPSGAVITISDDGGLTSKPLKDVDGVTDITELDKGFVEVIADATFFTLRSRGGGDAPWLHDWSAYETVVDWSGSIINVPANSWSTFLEVNNEEGFLTFVRADNRPGQVRSVNPSVRITIDGEVFIFDGVTTGSQNEGNLILQPIHFKDSLKIEIFNRNLSNVATLSCDYSYLKKINSTDVKKQTLLLSSERKMARMASAESTNVDVVSINGSGYLLGIEFSAVVFDSNAMLRATINIDNTVIMNDRDGIFHPMGSGSKQHIFKGPIRFNNSLRIRQRTSFGTTGLTIITRAFYTLD